MMLGHNSGEKKLKFWLLRKVYILLFSQSMNVLRVSKFDIKSQELTSPSNVMSERVKMDQQPFNQLNFQVFVTLNRQPLRESFQTDFFLTWSQSYQINLVLKKVNFVINLLIVLYTYIYI